MPWRNELYARLSRPVAAVLRGIDARQAACLEEIRVRLMRPVELVFSSGSSLERLILDREQMDELIAALSGYALYAFEQQMAQGFIPLPGGHRAGICGRAVEERGRVVRMVNVTSVCIRIARRVEGASETVRPYLLDEDGQPLRVLLLGAPGCGKTTVLRDAAVYLSDCCALHVALADEREELYMESHDVHSGLRMDVLRGAGKAKTMRMLLRTLAPQVIVTDEVGAAEDAEALMEAARSGIGLLASAHGGALNDVFRRPVLRSIHDSGVFDRYILLGRHGVCREVRNWEEMGAIGQLGDCSHGDDWHQRNRICRG